MMSVYLAAHPRTTEADAEDSPAPRRANRVVGFSLVCPTGTVKVYAERDQPREVLTAGEETNT